MKLFCRKNTDGFTLSEAIIIVAIIGILAAILVPSALGYVSNSRREECMTELRSLSAAYSFSAAENKAENEADCMSCLEEAVTMSGGSFDNDIVGICPDGGHYRAFYSHNRGGYYIYCDRHGADSAETFDSVDFFEISADAARRTLGNPENAVRVNSHDGSRCCGEISKALSLNGSGAEDDTWSVICGGGELTVYWSDMDVSSLSAGTALTVLKYDALSGQLWSGTAKTAKVGGLAIIDLDSIGEMTEVSRGCRSAARAD